MENRCPRITAEGRSEQTEASLDAKAGLSKLIAKLASIGASSAIKYQEESYSGPLRADIASILHDTANCSSTLSKLLVERLIPEVSKPAASFSNSITQTGQNNGPISQGNQFGATDDKPSSHTNTINQSGRNNGRIDQGNQFGGNRGQYSSRDNVVNQYGQNNGNIIVGNYFGPGAKLPFLGPASREQRELSAAEQASLIDSNKTKLSVRDVRLEQWNNERSPSLVVTIHNQTDRTALDVTVSVLGLTKTNFVHRGLMAQHISIEGGENFDAYLAPTDDIYGLYGPAQRRTTILGVGLISDINKSCIDNSISSGYKAVCQYPRINSLITNARGLAINIRYKSIFKQSASLLTQVVIYSFTEQ